jgi:hypothetical protein
MDLFNQPPYTPKELGIIRSETKQEQLEPGWQDLAIEKLKIYIQSTNQFITEDFRLWAEQNGLSQPPEPRAYGALILKAIKLGLIRWSGHYQEMKNPKSHNCPKKVWLKN